MDKDLNSIEDDLVKIRDLALKSILFEVLITPKPGLVDRLDSGIHGDMNIYTFAASASTLPFYLLSFLKIGYSHSGSQEDLFTKLRKEGQRAEKAMFSETDNINTHKGMIFIFATVLGAIGFLKKEKKEITKENLAITIKELVQKNLNQDLADIKQLNNKFSTAGEKLYSTQGIRGIRGEALAGFSKILNDAVDFFLEIERNNPKISLNDQLVNLFLFVVTKIEDTNMIKKCGLAVYRQIIAEIKDFLANNLYNSLDESSLLKFKKIETRILKNNLSPGGSADMTALAIFFIQLFHGKLINKLTREYL